ncbi:MAG: hypothetical protein LBN31_13490 [Hungatella sp.]|nr:hypothetical protein [Hungatella sp.]
MKSTFLGFGITICSILSIAIVLTLCSASIRQNELNHAVEHALKDTMENQFDQTTYSANSNEELVADFMEALLVQVNSDSRVTVQVLDVDYQKGLLSVEVKETYHHPIGTEGHVTTKRTVIMEQYQVPVS